eukprot:gnl/TRDRNA2_/TRDRNA2_168493_c1_seq1.p1 gnl/TRDRNA2_/TRDRNA2_168493_c1~~gnl/TRDRNA2_/TRDRNA2_168493_c1_seq1.p1  ORF type:complete len:585 (-),score=59.50 gnl/TRDRNA2_/TRDRNA2_168493_c1_seq1:30-1784(-)
MVHEVEAGGIICYEERLHSLEYHMKCGAWLGEEAVEPGSSLTISKDGPWLSPALTALARDKALVCYLHKRGGGRCERAAACECQCTVLSAVGIQLTKGSDFLLPGDDFGLLALTALSASRVVVCLATQYSVACHALIVSGVELSLGAGLVLSAGASRNLVVAEVGARMAVACYEALHGDDKVDFGDSTRGPAAVLKCNVLGLDDTTLHMGDFPLLEHPPSATAKNVVYKVDITRVSSTSSELALCYAAYGTCTSCEGHGFCEILSLQDGSLHRHKERAFKTEAPGVTHLVVTPLVSSSADLLFCYVETDHRLRPKTVCDALLLGNGRTVLTKSHSFTVSEKAKSRATLAPCGTDCVVACYETQAQAQGICDVLRTSSAHGGARTSRTPLGSKSSQQLVAAPVQITPVAQVAGATTATPTRAQASTTAQVTVAPAAEEESEGLSIGALVVLVCFLFLICLAASRCVYRICWLSSTRQEEHSNALPVQKRPPGEDIIRDVALASSQALSWALGPRASGYEKQRDRPFGKATRSHPIVLARERIDCTPKPVSLGAAAPSHGSPRVTGRVGRAQQRGETSERRSRSQP